MAFTFGFYNSLNHDRVYNAEQVSSIFDGLITDGVFDTIGEIFAVVPESGMQVNVKTGKAWFNHTWNVNDSWMPLFVEPADVLLNRYDTVVIDVDARDTARTNSIKIVKGIASLNPEKPTLANMDKWHQHPLAHILVEAGTEAITAANIEIVVGTSACPFVTGPLETVPIDDLYQQWEAEFDAWFANLKAQLTDNVVTNLQNQIDEKVDIADKATGEQLASTNDTNWVTPKGVSQMIEDETGSIVWDNTDYSRKLVDNDYYCPVVEKTATSATDVAYPNAGAFYFKLNEIEGFIQPFLSNGVLVYATNGIKSIFKRLDMPGSSDSHWSMSPNTGSVVPSKYLVYGVCGGNISKCGYRLKFTTDSSGEIKINYSILLRDMKELKVVANDTLAVFTGSSSSTGNIYIFDHDTNTYSTYSPSGWPASNLTIGMAGNKLFCYMNHDDPNKSVTIRSFDCINKTASSTFYSVSQLGGSTDYYIYGYCQFVKLSDGSTKFLCELYYSNTSFYISVSNLTENGLAYQTVISTSKTIGAFNPSYSSLLDLYDVFRATVNNTEYCIKLRASSITELSADSTKFNIRNTNNVSDILITPPNGTGSGAVFSGVAKCVLAQQTGGNGVILHFPAVAYFPMFKFICASLIKDKLIILMYISPYYGSNTGLVENFILSCSFSGSTNVLRPRPVLSIQINN